MSVCSHMSYFATCLVLPHVLRSCFAKILPLSFIFFGFFVITTSIDDHHLKICPHLSHLVTGGLTLPPIPPHLAKGLSPKKTHEITHFAAYLKHLVHHRLKVISSGSRTPADVVFVDVGSGMGYLGECGWGFML